MILDLAGRAWATVPSWVRRSVLRALNPSYLVGVVGIIEDPAGRVLLLEHRFRVQWPWGLPGGYVQRGEAFVDALGRELDEEIGLAAELAPDVVAVEINERGRYLTAILGGRVAEAGPLRPKTGEIVGGGWFAPDALPSGIDPFHARTIAGRPVARTT